MVVKNVRHHGLDGTFSSLLKTVATSNKTGDDNLFDEESFKKYLTWMKRRMMRKNVPDHLLRFFLAAYGEVHGNLRTNKQLVGAVIEQLTMETDDEDSEDEDEENEEDN